MKFIKTIITLIALYSMPVFSHPHSFVDLKTNVIVEGSMLKSFQMEWMLDEIASSELIYEVKNSQDKEKLSRISLQKWCKPHCKIIILAPYMIVKISR